MLMLAPDARDGPDGSPPRGDTLLQDLVASGRRRGRNGLGWATSLAGHTLVLGALLLVPVLWPERLPSPSTDLLRVLIYDPPPPPPLPPPRGSGLLERARATAAPATPEPPKVESSTLPPLTLPPPSALAERGADEPSGAPEGSPTGVPEGMEGGVEGGTIGGVPGGVLGGVIGGTGTGPVPVPVMDYDRPPRPLRTPKPAYPNDAFVKKVEGTVLLEILIDDAGRVARVRVVESVPMLDAAAVRAVQAWIFEPAIRKGRRVPTLASAPVTFRIF